MTEGSFQLLAIKELHQYSSTVRRAFLEKLVSLPWEKVTKEREASWHSMKDIMLHMIDNEDMIVRGQILKAPDYKSARDWGYTPRKLHLGEPVVWVLTLRRYLQ